MSSNFFPIVGNWYKDQTEQIFEVVSLDEEENHIEIQYFGGEIDEMDFESWEAMGVETMPPPEDWSGAYDQIDKDDLGYSDILSRADYPAFSIEDIE